METTWKMPRAVIILGYSMCKLIRTNQKSLKKYKLLNQQIKKLQKENAHEHWFQSTWRELPTMGKQLVNFITCGCESSAPFLQFTKTDANPRRIGDRLV
jgi:hypothetical protein